MAEAEAQASEARPAKRIKFSDDGLSHSTPGHSITSSSSHLRVQLKRHPEIWFDDGNIVLVAGDSEIAYRIYRGLLAAQSTVFSDMFTSSTSSPDETFDGCPVVYLSDSPYDLAHLLRVLLPMLKVNYRPTKEDPTRTFDEISAVIRLAHKYHIPQVQNQALSSLQDYHFTNSFSVFFNAAPRKPHIIVDPIHAIGAVNLARLTDTPSMLPLALYRCAYLGSTAGRAGTGPSSGSPTQTSGGASLPASCSRTSASSSSRASWIPPRAPPSAVSPRAAAHARAMSREAVRAEEEEGAGDGVLRDWKQSIGMLTDFGKSLCARCVEELVKRSMNERRSLWNRLPEIFGIEVEDWGEPEVVAETGLTVGDTEDDSSDDSDLELF